MSTRSETLSEGAAAALTSYRDQGGAAVERFGRRYLARSGDPDVPKGEWAADRAVLVEFPDLDAARAWNSSSEYQAIAPLRTENPTSVRLLVQGLG